MQLRTLILRIHHWLGLKTPEVDSRVMDPIYKLYRELCQILRCPT